MIRLYLAGPEVFHRDAIQLGIAKQLMCARFHYQGLYPLDGAPPPGTPAEAASIYARCMTLMHQADAGIFNLSPFRGPSADVGTVLELGVMAALGKPVFAYTHAAEDLIERLRASPGLTRDEAAGLWRDPRRPQRRGFWLGRQFDARRDVGEPGPHHASRCRAAGAAAHPARRLPRLPAGGARGAAGDPTCLTPEGPPCPRCRDCIPTSPRAATA